MGVTKAVMTTILHIGKTGGSAVKRALRPHAKTHNLILTNHFVSLPDVPVGEPVVFSVRDPESRFVSAFNSRLRKGRPLHNKEWSAQERIAFEIFETANDLAEALSSDLVSKRTKAIDAMNSIFHVSHRLSHWLVSPSYLLSRANDILLVLDQSHLTADFEVLKRKLNLEDDVRLTTDPVRAHKTPEDMSTHLSKLASANILNWYAADFLLYSKCCEIRTATLHQASRSS
jgi:hypothetical protein